MALSFVWLIFYEEEMSDQGFESRCMSVELIFFVKTFLYKFYDFFCRRHSLMNRPCCNNLLQFMQHNKFRNLKACVRYFLSNFYFFTKMIAL